MTSPAAGRGYFHSETLLQLVPKVADETLTLLAGNKGREHCGDP